jgi:hypothetical protein
MRDKSERGEAIEGEPGPPFRILANGEPEPGGFETLEEAKAAVRRRPLGKRHQIIHRRMIVWPPHR